MTKTTKVAGTITEQHVSQIEATFGKEIADKVEKAEEGATFLSIVFADFAK